MTACYDVKTAESPGEVSFLCTKSCCEMQVESRGAKIQVQYSQSWSLNQFLLVSTHKKMVMWVHSRTDIRESQTIPGYGFQLTWLNWKRGCVSCHGTEWETDRPHAFYKDWKKANKINVQTKVLTKLPLQREERNRHNPSMNLKLATVLCKELGRP